MPVNVGAETVPVSVAGAPLKLPTKAGVLTEPDGVYELVDPPSEVSAAVARATGVNRFVVSAAGVPVNIGVPTAPVTEPAGVYEFIVNVGAEIVPLGVMEPIVTVGVAADEIVAEYEPALLRYAGVLAVFGKVTVPVVPSAFRYFIPEDPSQACQPLPLGATAKSEK